MDMIKVVNGEAVPYTPRQLRRDNRQISFPENFPASYIKQFNVYYLVEAERPEYNADTSKLVPGNVRQRTDDQWEKSWIVVPLTEEELLHRRELKAFQEVLSVTSRGEIINALIKGVEGSGMAWGGLKAKINTACLPNKVSVSRIIELLFDGV